MLRLVALGLLGLILLSGIGYSAPMSGTANLLGGASGSVPHCKVSDSQTTLATGLIDIMQATVVCNATGSYSVTVTVVSGANNTTGQTTLSLTANTPATAIINTPLNISISGSTYTATWEVKAG